MIKSEIKKTLIIIISFSVYCIALQLVPLREYQSGERKVISDYNQSRIKQGLSSLKYDKNLNSVAQKEANRLAKLGKLEYPKLNLKENYVGFSFRVNGINEDEYVGDRVCFDNIGNKKDTKVYKYTDSCVGSYVDSDLYSKVGIGFAKDNKSRIFNVRIYGTTQSKI